MRRHFDVIVVAMVFVTCVSFVLTWQFYQQFIRFCDVLSEQWRENTCLHTLRARHAAKTT